MAHLAAVSAGAALQHAAAAPLAGQLARAPVAAVAGRRRALAVRGDALLRIQLRRDALLHQPWGCSYGARCAVCRCVLRMKKL